MVRALTLCWRQLTEVLHQRKLLAFLLALPILLMVLFGSAFSGQTTDKLIANYSFVEVLELEDIPKSFLISLVGMCGNFSLGNDSLVLEGAFLIQKQDLEEQAAYVFMIPDEEVQVIVFYEGAYIHALVNENQSAVRVSEGNITDLIVSYDGSLDYSLKVDFESIYSNETAMGYMRALEDIITMEPLIIEDYRLIDLLIPDFFIIIIMWTGIMGTAITTVEDRVTGVRKRVLLTPTSGFSVVFGNTLANMVLVGLQLLIIFAIAVLAFNVVIEGSLLLIALIFLITMLCMVGIGLVIANFSKSSEEAFYLSMMISFPMMLLGTSFFSLGRAAWANSISSIFPVSYASESLRSVMLFGAGWDAIASSVAVIAVFAVVIYFIGVYLTSRERDR